MPRLDSRTWDELIAEARALIPELAPGWTDHNAHDPGITLLELFAWLTELQLFQLDRVSPEMMRAYLRFVGVAPRAAGVATTAVALRQLPGAGPLNLPAGFVCETRSGDVDATAETVFESPYPLTISQAWMELNPAEGTARGRILVDDGSSADGGTAGGAPTGGGAVLDVTTANMAVGRRFAPFGERPRPQAALRLGFTERPAEPGAQLSLYVWAAEPQAVLDPDHDAPDLHHWARTSWECLADATGWQPLEVVIDETRALTRTGRVVLVGPAVHQPDSTEGRYWIRCRLSSGGYECPPELLAVAVNATPVRHAASVRGAEQLGRSRGAAAQSFRLAHSPVVAGSTRLRVVAGGTADDDWQEVSEWDLTGPDDRHYRVGPHDGTVAFGDGRRGRVPPAGATIEASGYQVGSGAAGNLSAGSLTRVVGAGALLPVFQPFPAVGGAAAESLSQAHGRALDSLAHPTRGVTVADLEALALETPGLPFGRAHAVPGHHPAYGCLPAAGAVTVVVLPGCGDPPIPSPGFIAAVCRYLQPRRPLATELHVVGPTYVTVTVCATLHVSSEAPDDVASHAVTALGAYFHPLTGGPDGRGWPFGRDVYETEVMAMLNAMPTVRYVDELEIRGPDDAASSCGNLPLCQTDLVRSGPHRIHVERSER